MSLTVGKAVTLDGVVVRAQQSLEGVDLVEDRVDIRVLFVALEGWRWILSEIRIAR
jgi:hypothetical protein